MKLLVVEDNPALGILMQAHFQARGGQVTLAATGAAALAALRPDGTYDAVLLDLGLPDMDGLAVLRALRAAGGDAAVLIVTARDAVAQRIAGLDGGADDYVLKPFDLAELEARLRAVLRRRRAGGGEGAADAVFGGVTLVAAERELRAGGRRQALTPREAALMAALMETGGRVAVRDALADQLYGSADELSANALEANVSRLRRKLMALGPGVVLDTVRGIGYRLRVEADN